MAARTRAKVQRPVFRGAASCNVFSPCENGAESSMAGSFGKLVVRSHAPKRRAVLLGLAVLLALAVLYAAFEFGRYDAGFRARCIVGERTHPRSRSGE
jgi:hypothetical protein